MKHAIEKKINDIISSTNKLDCTIFDVYRFTKKYPLDGITNIITITGTNGKGSTICLLQHALLSNNQSCISNMSPHLIKFNERIIDNGYSISDEDLFSMLCILENNFLDRRLTYPAVSFLCAYYLAYLKKPTWLLLEVGLGGRLDYANTLNADIAGITNVSLDHTDVLGDTVELICYQKIHIARKGKPFFYVHNLDNYSRLYLKKIGAKTIQAGNYSNIIKNKIETPVDSYNLAYSIMDHLISIKKVSNIPRNFSIFSLPGRCRIIKEHPITIVDVSHNSASSMHFYSWLYQQYTLLDYDITAIFSCNENKDINNIINSFKLIVNEWLLPDMRDIDIRQMDPKITQESISNSQVFDTMADVCQYIKTLNKLKTMIIVFGSFVTVGEFINECNNIG